MNVCFLSQSKYMRWRWSLCLEFTHSTLVKLVQPECLQFFWVLMQTPHLLRRWVINSHCLAKATCSKWYVNGQQFVVTSWSADCLKSGHVIKDENVSRAAGSPPTFAFINIHPQSNFAFLPPTVCSAWSSSASRLKPINNLYLINKWNNLFSYFWVAH